MFRILINSLIILVMISISGFVPAQDTAAKIPDTVSAVTDASGGLLGESPLPSEETWKITFQKVFWSFLILLIVWIGSRYLTRIMERIGERYYRYRLMVKRFIPVLRILIWAVVIYFIIANILAPPWATLLALLASAGIAVGFAAQDILKNVFGGIMILFDKPFHVGDKVEIGEYYGEVIDIGLRTVRLVTPDDSRVTVPNNLIINTSVSNSNSGASNCQVVAEFYLLPDVDLKALRGIAVRAAAASRYVYLKKPIVVLFKAESEMGQTRVKMRLKAYVLDIRYEFQFLSEMTENVISEFQKRGIEWVEVNHTDR
jgi:small-conductance mechanosensitive channel